MALGLDVQCGCNCNCIGHTWLVPWYTQPQSARERGRDRGAYACCTTLHARSLASNKMSRCMDKAMLPATSYYENLY